MFWVFDSCGSLLLFGMASLLTREIALNGGYRRLRPPLATISGQFGIDYEVPPAHAAKQRERHKQPSQFQ